MPNLPVSYEDVVDALPRVRSVLKPTPLFEWSGLSELLGCEYFVKHENHQPVGAFKIRGGINLVSTLSDEERAVGILGCSTGNHGQSLAFAARRFGVECTIVVPVGTNPGKVAAIRRLGSKLIEHGRDFDEARAYVESELVQTGLRYVHSANEPKLIAGVGSMAVEMFDDLPDPDVILVPIGLGSGVASTCIVAKALRPETQVIGIQAEGAPAIAMSWKNGQIDTDYECNTWAEGVATRVPAEMTFGIMKELLDDVILVSDDEMRQAVYWLLEHTHNLAEGAGAATLAAAWRERSRFAGQKVVGVLSGGNLDLGELPKILELGRQ
ncbi:MAG: threonine dehydratase [Planctomycetota bacterium]|nr:threonine dehydratase [Planctomycetota bacterium]